MLVSISGIFIFFAYSSDKFRFWFPEQVVEEPFCQLGPIYNTRFLWGDLYHTSQPEHMNVRLLVSLSCCFGLLIVPSGYHACCP